VRSTRPRPKRSAASSQPPPKASCSAQPTWPTSSKNWAGTISRPAALDAWLAEISSARGADPRLDHAIEDVLESLADLSELEFRARRIAEQVPTTKIVMLTVSDEETDLYDAVKAGASGYILKEISIDEVADAVRAVVAGQSLITPSMASKLLLEFNALAKQAEQRQPIPTPKLTNREIEVLEEVARGKSNREVADDLFISENTVKNHIRNILEKLQLHSRMEAVMYAMRENLIDIDDA
jgi:two-component system NarL family response regulator